MSLQSLLQSLVVLLAVSSAVSSFHRLLITAAFSANARPVACSLRFFEIRNLAGGGPLGHIEASGF